MNKIYTLVVSSKGQVTIPIELRRMFKVNKPGDKLRLKLNQDGNVNLLKPSNLDDLHQYLAPKLKGKKPLENPREFYKNREPRI
jgi:bifunctional DNA-binding transcriptional regulator/antitoxin component of YhaV-PrlF toxin-antitoxin module